MYFDDEEMAYAESLVGEASLDEFTQMCKEEIGYKDKSTPQVGSSKVQSWKHGGSNKVRCE